ncbi:MAG: hypothetical protein A2W99_03400 [Bacteroidetes bacterium GWF2_33_16]|nr:MAG: hypothetical protein A2X00_11670 [Bacteroidetes bacterium GWE2_32_14]OFY08233.1 MAG: hypothetical protein A2W99_03400 [Bacteroidetes bacterium GWF2_33_16]
MKKLNSLGIGPIIGGIALPGLAVTIFLSLKYKELFSFFESGNNILKIVGICLVIIGLVMYFTTAPLLLKGLKESKLITTGTYYLCCNPLYTSIILFVIPGISFWMNSWLILIISPIAYIMFKIYIKREYAEMELFFGDNYKEYYKKTPEFFPFPINKWLKK